MFVHRLRNLYLLLSAVLLVEAGRLFHLQVLSVSHDYAGRVMSRLYREEVVEAVRGTIRDKNGSVLAADRARFDLLINYDKLPKPEEWLEPVRELTGVSSQALLDRAQEVLENVQRIRRAVPPRYVKIREETIPHALVRNIPFEAVARLEAQPERYPGISARLTCTRWYPGGSLACHALGFLGTLREEEAPPPPPTPSGPLKGYLPGDTVGKSGVERQYDVFLQGTRGRRLFEKNFKTGDEELVIETPALCGHTVWLTLDSRVQRAAERALQGKVGALVVMDVETGGILALASSPGYDLNRLREDLPRLAADERDKPLLNRGIQDPVPLASVMKVPLSIAALEGGQITESSRLTCTGAYRVGDAVFICPDRYAHGSLTVREALEHSCNVFFYQVGRLVGVERIVPWSRRLGLGARTGIDLPHEWPGRIPDPEWFEAAHGRPWYEGDTVNLSIGHGDVQVTPLQTAVMMAAVANGGKVLRPHVLMQVTDPDGKVVSNGDAENLVRAVEISEHTLRVVQEGMKRVVQTGTARNVHALKPLRVSGKTGTGATAVRGLYYAWFAGFAPSDRPRVSFAALVHRTPQGGASVAAPIAAEALKTFFEAESKAVAAAGPDPRGRAGPRRD